VIGGVQERDYRLHLKKRGAEPVEISAENQYPARRWVIERTHSWHNRFRRLLVRWEKKLDHFYAMIDLASMLAREAHLPLVAEAHRAPGEHGVRRRKAKLAR